MLTVFAFLVLTLANFDSVRAAHQPLTLSTLGTKLVKLANGPQDGRVYDLAFSPARHSQVCAFALDRAVQLWDVSAEPHEIATLTPPLPREFNETDAAPTPHPIAYSSDGSRLAVGYFGIQIWDVGQRKLLFAIPLLWEPEAIGFFRPDDAFAVVCSWRGLYKLKHPVPGKIQVFGKGEYERMRVKDPLKFDIHRNLFDPGRTGTDPPEVEDYYCLAVYPDGKRFVAGGDSALPKSRRRKRAKPFAKVWDIATGRPIFTIGDNERPIVRFCLSPDGCKLYSCGDMVLGWDATKSTPPTKTFDTSGRSTVSIAISPDGAMLAAGGLNGTVTVWSPEAATKLATLTHSAGPVYRLAFSTDSSKLVAAGVGGIATVWRMKLSTKEPTGPDNRGVRP
jgi:WD40 repeat protein